jgi:hypothetical protein
MEAGGRDLKMSKKLKSICRVHVLHIVHGFYLAEAKPWTERSFPATPSSQNTSFVITLISSWEFESIWPTESTLRRELRIQA